MAVASEGLLTSPELQRRMAERAGSTNLEIENGHMLPMMKTDEVPEVSTQAAKAVNQSRLSVRTVTTVRTPTPSNKIIVFAMGLVEKNIVFESQRQRLLPASFGAGS